MRPSAELSHLVAHEGALGQVAAYNLGTLLGERHEYERALAELRRALERNPGDADARWNYELMMREHAAAQARQQPKPGQKPPKQTPAATGAAGRQGCAAATGRPAAALAGPGTPPNGNPPPRSGSGALGGMSREQAEQLLGSLQELERLEKQRARMNRVTQERKGKDW